MIIFLSILEVQPHIFTTGFSLLSQILTINRDPPLVLDMCITHERWGSSLNGQLHYPSPGVIDSPLNEIDVDKIRDYHTDCNNRPSNTISFIPAVTSTSDLRDCVSI